VVLATIAIDTAIKNRKDVRTIERTVGSLCRFDIQIQIEIGPITSGIVTGTLQLAVPWQISTSAAIVNAIFECQASGVSIA
jgi:hypothetical protein